ncbi:enamine deaminase RidA (YjgF/YER057c/UK114 family) [Pedobacter cryoconitis]|uniref:RidA family protein n=1 Tax=Pedobacter cryoconitis TaxID=188932 RepID=UPI0017D318EA|nr:RidA family protein [Pedobacter cryoconitis]MBB6272347.1 enamine deaminase RidA (YjgF/YER057c/UK114 family) [Pedobacter cryoconitis]
MKTIQLLLIMTILGLLNQKGLAQEITNPKGLYDPRQHGYSHVATVPANSILVFVAGQAGTDAEGKLSDDFRTQVRFTFENLAIALKSKGLQMKHIAKLTTLVVDYDAEKHKILIEEGKKVWPDEKFPVNTLIPVPRLALDGMLIEIDATAVMHSNK